MFRTGLVGYGSRAKAHVKAIQGIEDAELAAISEVDDAKRRQAEEELKVKTYADFREMITPENLNAVIVATPSFVHREPTLTAAKAGLHVLCEKPMALKLEDADAMIAACDEAGVKLMVGFGPPFNPRYRTLLNIYRSGEMGELVYCWSKQSGYFPLKGWEQRRRDGSWRMSQELSGGRVMEMSSHDMCWLTDVGGDVVSVVSRLAAFTPDVETDELNVSMLGFRTGFGFLEMSKGPTAIKESSVGIMGKNGSISCVNGKMRMRMLGEEDERELPLQPCDSLHEHFFRCLREDTQPGPDGRCGRRVLAACLAILESGAAGKAVDLKA